MLKELAFCESVDALEERTSREFCRMERSPNVGPAKVRERGRPTEFEDFALRWFALLGVKSRKTVRTALKNPKFPWDN